MEKQLYDGSSGGVVLLQDDSLLSAAGNQCLVCDTFVEPSDHHVRFTHDDPIEKVRCHPSCTITLLDKLDHADLSPDDGPATNRKPRKIDGIAAHGRRITHGLATQYDLPSQATCLACGKTFETHSPVLGLKHGTARHPIPIHISCWPTVDSAIRQTIFEDTADDLLGRIL